MQNKTKNFTFLPNGKPLSTLKNEAKKLKKQSKFKTLSEAQNALSRSLFNKPLNKLSKNLEERSPVVISGILYLPLVVNTKQFECFSEEEEFCYYVAMNDKELGISKDMGFYFDNIIYEGFVENLSFSSFEKILTDQDVWNGWHIKLDKEYFIEVKTTDEGVVADLYFDNGSELDAFRSCYILFEEMVGFNYESIKNDSVSDYKAVHLFGHELESDSTVFYTIGEIDCALSGTWILTNEEGQFIKPEEMIAQMKQAGTEKEFWSWLYGKDNDLFEGFEVMTAPYFEYQNEEGDLLGEVFDTLPKSLSEKTLEIAEFFVIER